ncbi:hypothetical protein NUACC21_81820 [Scytonema sp. NUACC21]
MKYIFEIVGVSPVLTFFNHQQQNLQKSKKLALEYIASHKCTLDAFIKSVEPVPPKWGWDKDDAIGSVIEFWMNNAETIWYWKSRLIDAGSDNLLVARIGDLKALKAEFDLLLKDS